MGDIRASLYDIFGYLLPGIFSLTALWIVSWTIFHPNLSLDISPLSNSTVAGGIGVIAYVLGHFTHAVGNWILATKSTNFQTSPNRDKKPNPISTHFQRTYFRKEKLELVDEALKQKFGEEYLKLSQEDKFSIIDEYRVLSPKENEREVFVYREGFYRGMIIALSMLFIALLVSLFQDNLSVSVAREIYSASRGERLFILCSTILVIAGFWRRMVRFAYYRMSRAVAIFLILSKLPPKQ